MDNIIMSFDYLKHTSASVLASHLKELVWGDLEVGSTESNLVEEAIIRLKKDTDCITETQYQENLDWAAKSYNAAFKGKLVPCRGCEKEFELLKLFRCFHCGSYLCPKCARAHFGEREESLHDAAMLANLNVAEVS